MAKEDEATQPYGRTPRRHRIDTPVRVSDTETDVTQSTAAAEEVKSLIGSRMWTAEYAAGVQRLETQLGELRSQK